MVSVVLTTYNRAEQLRRTLLSIAAQEGEREVIVIDDGTDDMTPFASHHLCDYSIRLDRPSSTIHRNPANPLNFGIRQAKGDIIILQNAECQHIDPQTIAKMTSLVTDTNAVFARVIALDEAGNESVLYCGQENPRPYFFCGAIKRDWFLRLRGFDEEYTTYGFDDDDMADRLRREGVEFVFTDILVHHQWHPQAGDVTGWEAGREMFERKKTEPTVRNVGRDWGVLA